MKCQNLEIVSMSIKLLGLQELALTLLSLQKLKKMEQEISCKKI